MPTPIYCTYLTIYTGNKLPPFYIGSSTVDKVNKGYHGSVKSKKYKELWEEELNINPLRFKTIILTTHNSRKEATEKELKFQRNLNVVLNPLYINQSLASPNGYFGVSKKGKEHPSFGILGRKDTIETREKKSKSHTGISRKPFTKQHKQNIKEAKIKWHKENPGKSYFIRYNKIKDHRGDKNPMFGKRLSDDQKNRISHTWEITLPNGEQIIIKNLKKYCIDNKLDISGMKRVSLGKQLNYKGYHCRKISD